MKWFDRWFYSKVRWANVRGGYEFSHLKEKEDILDSATEMYHSNEDQFSVVEHHELKCSEEDPHTLYDGLKIDIKKVVGGLIITVRHPYKSGNQTVSGSYDEPRRCTYMIKDEEDFDKSLSRIITMEILKQ